MEIQVIRKQNGDTACTGEMLVDGQHECLTLEDRVRDLKVDGSGKVYGETAIPAGRYRVTIDFSQKFQKRMIHVMDVPFFTGIRIHSGNTDKDTLGCILVGDVADSPVKIHGGSSALPRLFNKIEYALNSGQEVWLTITEEF